MELAATLSMAMALVAVLVVFVLSSVVLPCGWRKSLNLPPGPQGWPVLGRLGVLEGAAPPHRVLAALAARHGPLMHLRLGSYHTVVASSAETARLVLKTHDLAFAFADRPPTAAGEITSYGYRGTRAVRALLAHGAQALCHRALLGAPRQLFERVRAQEMRALAIGLFRCAGRTVRNRPNYLD